MKSGLLLVKLQQFVLKRGELEEMIFLGNDLRGTAAERAIDGVGVIGDVQVVVNAIAALVKRFVDVAGIARAQKQPAHGAQVLGRGGAHKMRIADAEFVPKRAKHGGIAVHQFAGRDAGLGRGARDIFAVLVGPGKKGDIVAHACV